MAVPRNRSSNSKKNSRRAHHSKNPVSTQSCTNCGVLSLPHRMCVSCGFYKNKAVIQNEEV